MLLWVTFGRRGGGGGYKERLKTGRKKRLRTPFCAAFFVLDTVHNVTEVSFCLVYGAEGGGERHFYLGMANPGLHMYKLRCETPHGAQRRGVTVYVYASARSFLVASLAAGSLAA